jgi:hypothetical protein
MQVFPDAWRFSRVPEVLRLYARKLEEREPVVRLDERPVVLRVGPA